MNTTTTTSIIITTITKTIEVAYLKHVLVDGSLSVKVDENIIEIATIRTTICTATTTATAIRKS